MQEGVNKFYIYIYIYIYIHIYTDNKKMCPKKERNKERSYIKEKGRQCERCKADRELNSQIHVRYVERI